MRRSWLAWVSALVFGLLALVLHAPAARADGVHESTMSAPPDVFVTIHVQSGAVHVVGTNRREVKVSSTSDAVSMATSEGGARVAIVVREGGVPLNVFVPAAARVEVRCVEADVSVRDVTGPVQASSVNGNVEVAGGTRDVEARSVSGNVDLSLVRADVRAQSVSGTVAVRLPTGGTAWLRTVSGSVRLAGAPLTRVELQTLSGPVTFEGRLDGAGPFSARSHSGNIHIALPKNATTALEMRSFRGHVDTVDVADAGAAADAGHTVLSIYTFDGTIDVDRK